MVDPLNVVMIRIHNAWLYQTQPTREEQKGKILYDSRTIPVILFPIRDIFRAIHSASFHFAFICC